MALEQAILFPDPPYLTPNDAYTIFIIVLGGGG